jgi:hypothetical protein
MWPLGADCCQLRLIEVSLRCNLDVSRYGFVIEVVPLFLGQVLRKTTVGPVASPLGQTICPFVTNLNFPETTWSKGILKRSVRESLIWGNDFESRVGALLSAPEDFVLSLDNALPGCPVTQVTNWKKMLWR